MGSGPGTETEWLNLMLDIDVLWIEAIAARCATVWKSLCDGASTVGGSCRRCEMKSDKLYCVNPGRCWPGMAVEKQLSIACSQLPVLLRQGEHARM